jgi:hypothetical protein
MKPFVQGLVCAALCAAVCGCGGSQTRIWRSPRQKALFGSPGMGTTGGESIYAPPVAPPYEPAPASEPAPRDIAPPVRPGDLEPMPTPAVPLQTELPPPPEEEEESVQFTIPVPASPMPNVLNPVESKPLLEQSSGERPANGGPVEVLAEGKIALRMQGHSTFNAARSSRFPAQRTVVKPPIADLPQDGAMQVQYVPLLAPVPLN